MSTTQHSEPSPTHNLRLRDVVYQSFDRRWPLILVYVLVTLTIMAAWVASSFFLGRVVDGVATGEPHTAVKRNLIIMLALWAVLPVMGLVNDMMDRAIIPLVVTRVRQVIMAEIMRVHRRQIITHRVGDIVAKLTKVPYVTMYVIFQCREHMLPAVVGMTVVCAYLFWLHWSLGAIMVGGIAVCMAIAAAIVATTLRVSQEVDEILDTTTEAACDTLMQMPSVYAAGAEVEELRRMQQQDKAVRRQFSHMLGLVGACHLVFSVSYLLIFALLLFVTIRLVRRKVLTAGAVTSIGFVVSFAVYLMDDVTREIGDFALYVGNLRKAQQYLTGLGVVSQLSPDGLGAAGPRDGSIVLKNVNFSYAPGRPPVFQGVSLTVRHGERILLRGANGTGKSTLLALVCGNVPYALGSVRVGGVEVRDTQVQSLRNAIIYVPQRAELFDRSVYENIAYGSQATREEVQALLHRFQINFCELDTPAGKSGSNFSGGQRQIIFLLRAFLRNAFLLLLDEPTSAFDAATRNRTMRLVEEIMQDRTTLLVTHDPELEKYATRIVHFPLTTSN